MGAMTAPTDIVLPIVATTPLVVMPFAHFLEGDKITWRTLLGGAGGWRGCRFDLGRVKFWKFCPFHPVAVPPQPHPPYPAEKIIPAHPMNHHLIAHSPSLPQQRPQDFRRSLRAAALCALATIAIPPRAKRRPPRRITRVGNMRALW